MKTKKAAQVWVKFYMTQTDNEKEKFLFWSCLLDSCVDSVDSTLLEKSVGIIKLNHRNLKIITKFDDVNTIPFEKYNKRNPVFLSIDRFRPFGSPYKHSCSLLENYYLKVPFQIEFMHFLEKVELADCSAYERNEIQKDVISAIKRIIGIDILERGSIPGSIAVYSRLPKFELTANYNDAKGERYVQVNFEQDKDEKYFIENEIADDGKILYKELFELNPGEKIVFPDRNSLEPFGQIHISIFRNKDGRTSCVYEERGSLIKYISFGINVNSGNYKYIQNRFISKDDEKVALSHYENSFSKENGFDPSLVEREYKTALLGKRKEFLESCFFDDTSDGRKKFLHWVRNKLRRAKEVFIIDPYFDNAGLRDFNSCVTTYFLLSVLTTDPEKTERDGDKSSVDEIDLAETIYANFPQAKVYFVSRQKLHDRYLILFDGEETYYYSLSNSWNGTVNNYSLFIQELELAIALQVKNTYLKYFDDAYLQQKKKREEKKEETKKTFHNLFADVFQCENCGIAKSDILSFCLKKIPLLVDIDGFIKRLVFEVLTDQKESFKKANNYMDTEIGLDGFRDMQACMRWTISRMFCGSDPAFDLKIEYQLYKMLEACFAIFPNKVIDELCSQEKNICKFEISEGHEYQYFVSELIVSYMLSENYAYIPSQDVDELISFANKSENLYCRVYLSRWVMKNISDCADYDFLGNIEKILLTPKNMSLFLGNIYAEKKIIRNKKIEAILEGIEAYVSDRYKDDPSSLKAFAIYAYLLPNDIDVNGFKKFIKKNENVRNDLEVFFLYYALYIVPSKKFSSLIKKFLDDDLCSHLPPFSDEEKPSIGDVRKFMNYMPYLGAILAELIRKTPSMLSNIVYKFEIYPKFVFELDEFPSDEFDCYVLVLILYCLNNLKKESFPVDAELDKIQWYVPCMLNMHGQDAYGLSFYLLDEYVALLPSDKREQLMYSLFSVQYRIFVATTLPDKLPQYEDIIREVLNAYEVKNYGGTNDIIYLLALFINLVLYSTESEQKIVSSILTDIQNVCARLKNENIDSLIYDGIAYYSKKNHDCRSLFLEKVKSLYCPVSAQKFTE